MRVQGSYHPPQFEFEKVDGGETALMRFYENIEPYEQAGTETTPAMSGYIFDRYTLARPYDEGLRERVTANVPRWLGYAKQEEINALDREARGKRNTLLAATDWTQTVDAPVSKESGEALRVYRQALRDLPEQPGYPYGIVWPEMPEIEAGVSAPSGDVGALTAQIEDIGAALDALLEGLTG